MAALALVALALAPRAGQGGAAPPAEESGREVAQDPGPLGDDDASSAAREVLSGADVTSYESELSLVEEGERLLAGYDRRDDCVVAQAGYLDLAGRTWGCVMQGEGWVEICVVREVAGRDGSEVVSWRLEAEDAEGLAAGP